MDFVKKVIRCLKSNKGIETSKNSERDTNTTLNIKKREKVNNNQNIEENTTLEVTNVENVSILSLGSHIAEQEHLTPKNEENCIEGNFIHSQDKSSINNKNEIGQTVEMPIEYPKSLRQYEKMVIQNIDPERAAAKIQNQDYNDVFPNNVTLINDSNNNNIRIENIVDKIKDIVEETNLPVTETENSNILEIITDDDLSNTSSSGKNNVEDFEIPISIVNGHSSDDIKNLVELKEAIDDDNKLESVVSENNQIEKLNPDEINNTINSKITAENIISDINPKEWLSLDEFANIMEELNSVGSSDVCDFEEIIDKYVVDKKITPKDNNSSTDTCNIDNINVKNENTKTKNALKHTVNETADDIVICISSDEENDLKLSLSLDAMETVSLGSIQTMSDTEINFHKCHSNVTLEETKDNANSIDLNNSLKNNVEFKVESPKVSTVDVKQSTDSLKLQHNAMQSEVKIETSINDIRRNTEQKTIEFKVTDSLEIKLNLNSETRGSQSETYGPDNEVMHRDESTLKDDIEVISITSNDSNDNVDSVCSGYNSSDFEFITEEEAKSDGLIINYSKETGGKVENGTCKTVKVTMDSRFECSNFRQKSESLYSDMPGPSRQVAAPKISWNTTRDPSIADYNYRLNHVIPEGDQYLGLFQGNYTPATQFLYENKSSSLRVYEGVGFDMRLMRRHVGASDVDEECKKEADENAKKILQTYPADNRKRRRRF